MNTKILFEMNLLFAIHEIVSGIFSSSQSSILMCGIAGFYSLTNQFSETDLHSMTNVMSHRGPDAAGFFERRKTCGVGHRRLSIIDLSTAANQPMFSQSERYVMVFNGEVYNFKEIAKQLNISPRTNSDTEIILEAFEQRGTEFVHLLNGMFAIAIYDKQKEKLFLFRDRLGVKPLYYFYAENNFAFGSEIKSLLAIDFVAQNIPLNKRVVSTFLYAGYIPERETIYQSIYKLPAGSFALVDKHGFEVVHYWKPEEKSPMRLLQILIRPKRIERVAHFIGSLQNDK